MKLFFLLLMSSLSLASSLEQRLEWLLHTPLLGLEKLETNDPPTLQTAQLGRLLFYDKRLSKDGTVSCASCHEVGVGFSSQTALSKGVGEVLGKRKSPVILNRAFQSTQFWDGSAASLEAQVLGPIENPLEMATTRDKVVETLAGIKGYAPYFVRAFGTPNITIALVQRAIADFERTLLSGGSRYDHWIHQTGQVQFTDLEIRGLDLFNERECHICHTAPSFTDGLFHNTGVAFKNGAFADEGRYGFTKTQGNPHDSELGAFKTPTLRNLTKHSPYMHDGSIPTLEAVIEFYNNGGVKNPHLDPDIIRLGLQPQDKTALLAFLHTLEGTGFEDTPPLPEEFPQ